MSSAKITKNTLLYEGANFLLVSWLDTVSSLSLPEDKDVEIFTLLGNYYKEDNRHYHNWKHIKSMLRGLHEYPENIVDPLAIELSIWFHDAVYVPLRQDNETKSAKLFKQELGEYLPKERVQKIFNYIEATKEHRPTGDKDLRVLLDLDLAILGQPAERFQAYTEQVRNEYALVPQFIYKRGRKSVLKNFLNRASIYQTPFFKENYEEQARENIKEELSSL